MRRKGLESAAPGVANLILVIILVLALYILFVPPAERQRILEGNRSTTSGGGTVSPLDPSVLLLEQPGRLSFLENKEFEHAISSFPLYRATESRELAALNAVYVTHSTAEARSRNATLLLDDLASIDNVMLSFGVEEGSGVLSIALNGEVIYEDNLGDSAVADPVKLPKIMLRQENVLSFGVSGPGWQFWHTNAYRLTDVKIVGDYTDLSKQQSRNTFFISDDESANIESSSLSFLPKCDEAQAGTLGITINTASIFSAVPDCGVANTLQFDPKMLAAGTNTVTFHTDAGSYVVEQTKIRTKMREDASVVYHFDINTSDYRRIKVGAEHVDLTLEFVDAGKAKEGELVINGHRTGFYTTERTVQKRIDAYVQEGGNAVRLVPKTSMDITNLIVKYD